MHLFTEGQVGAFVTVKGIKNEFRSLCIDVRMSAESQVLCGGYL